MYVYHGSGHSIAGKSEIFLHKGEEAYYYIEDRYGDVYLNSWVDCNTVGSESHSCTWLEIRKTGDSIA